MTHHRARYGTTSRQDHLVYRSDIHDSGTDEPDPFSTIEGYPIKARTKWACFLLGCAILLPWGALMNGMSFFLSRLVGSSFYTAFGSSVSSVYMLVKLACQFYCTFTSKQSSPSRRIFASVIASILLILFLFISTFIQGTPLTFFLLAMFSAASLAVMAGHMMTAVYAVASLLGTSFLQSVISGQAAIAVVTCTVQVASSVVSLWTFSQMFAPTETMASENGDDQAEGLAARISFGVSAVSLCVTLIAYVWLTRQPFYKARTGLLEQQGEVGEADELTGLVADHVRRNPLTESTSRVYHVFKRNLNFMFSVAYAYLITLVVFPTVTIRVQPVDPNVHPMLFTAVHLLVFNIGDLVGRYTCSLPLLAVWSAKKIAIMSFLRTAFIPLILLFLYRPTAISPVSSIIGPDLLFMIVLLAMGYTNGYVVAMGLLAVSSLEHNPGLDGRQEDVDTAATLGGSSTMIGLTIGALCSFAF